MQTQGTRNITESSVTPCCPGGFCETELGTLRILSALRQSNNNSNNHMSLLDPRDMLMGGCVDSARNGFMKHCATRALSSAPHSSPAAITPGLQLPTVLDGRQKPSSCIPAFFFIWNHPFVSDVAPVTQRVRPRSSGPSVTVHGRALNGRALCKLGSESPPPRHLQCKCLAPNTLCLLLLRTPTSQHHALFENSTPGEKYICVYIFFLLSWLFVTQLKLCHELRC